MEQLGSEACGLERAAELGDQRDHVHAQLADCGPSAEHCLGSEGGEADESRRAGRVRTRHQRAMALQLAEILAPSGEAPAPAVEELATDA